MPLSRIHQRRGFSLIEILVSVGIIAVIAVILGLTITQGVLIRTTKEQEIALRIATNKMEEVRALGYTSAPSSGSFTDTQLSTLSSATGTIAVSDYNATTKQVIVTVTWKGSGVAGDQTITLTNLITKIGGL